MIRFAARRCGMRRSREEWADLVSEFETSGETQEQFCIARGLVVGSLRGWLYRLRKERGGGKVARSATRMLPVRVRAGALARDSTEALIEVGVSGAVLRVPVGADVDYVASLASALSCRC
jgi:hypothetical protein